MLPTVVLITFVFLTVFRMGPLTPTMPPVSSCSATISANCHRPLHDEDAYLLPVQWGVSETDRRGRKRCSFTTRRDVAQPVVWDEYLGIPDEEPKEEPEDEPRGEPKDEGKSDNNFNGGFDFWS